jgi:hypothetical protein
MRLDRLDGTGDMVWADDIALFGAVKGVFDGLFEKEEIDLLPAPLFDCFLAHLFNCSFSDLMDIAQTLTPPDTRNPEEHVLTTRRLEDHITSLMDLIQAIS